MFDGIFQTFYFVCFFPARTWCTVCSNRVENGCRIMPDFSEANQSYGDTHVSQLLRSVRRSGLHPVCRSSTTMQLQKRIHCSMKSFKFYSFMDWKCTICASYGVSRTEFKWSHDQHPYSNGKVKSIPKCHTMTSVLIVHSYGLLATKCETFGMGEAIRILLSVQCAPIIVYNLQWIECLNRTSGAMHGAHM